MTTIDSNRGTGRTRDMLLRAVDFLKNGPENGVCIVCVHSHGFIDYCRRLLLSLCDFDVTERKTEVSANGRRVIFGVGDGDGPENPWMRGLSPACVLTDHWVFDKRLAELRSDRELKFLPDERELPFKIVNRTTPMTDEQCQQQRLSFAHGNCAIDNPLVTRQVVQDAADREVSVSWVPEPSKTAD